MTILYLCGAANPEGVRLALAINQKHARWDQIILLDDDPSKQGQCILGVEVAGPFETLRKVDAGSAEVSNMVARTTVKRWSAHCKIEHYGLPFSRIVHPSVDTLGVELGTGVTVYQNATVGASASVGDESVIFMGAAVGHGARLGRCCIVAPGAVINARARLEEGVYVGTNATILPEVRVGPWATIAAGSVAMRDVPAGATVLGVPGKILEFRAHAIRAGSASLAQ
jgi:sugar O-acyltransferase (sialic acid O-acetyltransferase NeuD family)